MGTYSMKSLLTVSKELEAAYQDISILLARLIRDPGDIAAIQKLAAKQAQLEKLESTQSALLAMTSVSRPTGKSYVA